MTISSSPSPTAVPSLRGLAAPYVGTLSGATSVAVEDPPQPPNPPRVNNYDTFNVFANRAAARRRFLDDRKRADSIAPEGAAQEEPTVPLVIKKTVNSTSREKDTIPTLEKRTENSVEKSTNPSAEKTGKIKSGLNPAAAVFQPTSKVLEESTNVDTTRHSPDCSRGHTNTAAEFKKVMDWNSGTAAGWCESDFPLSEFCKDDENVN